jgi:hypothetical protein
VPLFAKHNDPGGIDGLAIHSKKLPAGGCCLRPCVERADKVLDERGTKYGIRIKKQNVFGGKAARKLIVSFAEAKIHRRSHQVVDIERFDPLERFILRGVVENVNFEVFKMLPAEAFQTSRDVGVAVESHDVDGNFRRHHPFRAPRKTRP